MISLKEKKFKKSKYFYIIISFIIIYIMICLFYYTSSVLTPGLLGIAEAKYKSDAVEIIEQTSCDIYSKNYNYEDFITIEKDSAGNITMLRANTVKMSAVAQKVALDCTNKLKKQGIEGIKVSLGYASRNNILGDAGPDITVKMKPIDRVEIKYDSEFESAGINQTRHKIKVKLTAKIKIILPTTSKEVEVCDEIPISETIIVGKVPTTNLQLN